MTIIASLSFSWHTLSQKDFSPTEVTYDICDDPGQEQALLLLVWTFLKVISMPYFTPHKCTSYHNQGMNG